MFFIQRGDLSFHFALLVCGHNQLSVGNYGLTIKNVCIFPCIECFFELWSKFEIARSISPNHFSMAQLLLLWFWFCLRFGFVCYLQPRSAWFGIRSQKTQRMGKKHIIFWTIACVLLVSVFIDARSKTMSLVSETEGGDIFDSHQFGSFGFTSYFGELQNWWWVIAPIFLVGVTLQVAQLAGPQFWLFILMPFFLFVCQMAHCSVLFHRNLLRTTATRAVSSLSAMHRPTCYFAGTVFYSWSERPNWWPWQHTMEATPNATEKMKNCG